MYNNISEAHMAVRLHLRKDTHLKTTLVLGARTSALFRSPAFYQRMQELAPSDFQQAPLEKQFSQSFPLLQGREARLGRSEAELLLSSSLASIYPSEADHCLAKLIVQGYFDPVITTTADTLLEQALVGEGWRVLRDFEVFNLVSSPHKAIHDIGRYRTSTIFKVFGELASHNYLLARRRSHLETVPFLKDILGRDCLAIGLDEVWDADLLHLFPVEGDICWFVMPEEPGLNSFAHSLKETRQVQYYFDKTDGNYEKFIIKLYNAIREKAHESSYALPGQDLIKPVRSTAFISYSQKDKKYLGEFHAHLAHYVRAGAIEFWDDSKILPGAKWQDEIEKALRSARVAVFLVSADFLASDLIANHEVSPLLKAAEKEGVTILPIILRPCAFKDTVLAQFQAANSPTSPLSEMKPSKREKVWSQVAQHINSLLNS